MMHSTTSRRKVTHSQRRPPPQHVHSAPLKSVSLMKYVERLRVPWVVFACLALYATWVIDNAKAQINTVNRMLGLEQATLRQMLATCEAVPSSSPAICTVVHGSILSEQQRRLKAEQDVWDTQRWLMPGVSTLSTAGQVNTCLVGLFFLVTLAAFVQFFRYAFHEMEVAASLENARLRERTQDTMMRWTPGGDTKKDH